MQIGILSDTHGQISPIVLKHFDTVQQIFHAGDIGSISVIRELEKIAPVYAVSGNIDDWSTRKIFPPILFTKINKLKICMTHDIGSTKRFNFELFKKNQNADIIIHGHTHRSSSEIYQNKLFINPGSASISGGLGVVTVAILDLGESDYSYKFIEIDLAEK